MFGRKKHRKEPGSVPVDSIRYGLMGNNNVRTDRVIVPVDRKTWEEKYDTLLDETDGMPVVVYYRPEDSNEVWLVLKP